MSYSRRDYERGHIPNAVFVDWKRELADQNEIRYYKVAPEEDFERFMRKVGADVDTTLIFYDNRQNRLAIRAFWVVAYYGHRNAAVLEGGISAWKDKGFEITSHVPSVRETKYGVEKVYTEMNVEKAFVKQNLRNEGVIFVDGRPTKVFTGEIPGKFIQTGELVSRRGHLPGAVNIPWESNIDERNIFRDRDTLLRDYREKGLSDHTLIIFYCNEGLHASYGWFVAEKLLGFANVKIYDGSMGEWADDPMLPLVTGIGF